MIIGNAIGTPAGPRTIGSGGSSPSQGRGNANESDNSSSSSNSSPANNSSSPANQNSSPAPASTQQGSSAGATSSQSASTGVSGAQAASSGGGKPAGGQVSGYGSFGASGIGVFSEPAARQAESRLSTEIVKEAPRQGAADEARDAAIAMHQTARIMASVAAMRKVDDVSAYSLFGRSEPETDQYRHVVSAYGSNAD